MKLKVNSDIALTHVLTRKKQTLIASLGVTVGISIFIFMISLVVGFNRNSDAGIFKSIPHIRIYREDEISRPLPAKKESDYLSVIVNPKISNLSDNLINPMKLIADLKRQDDVVTVTQQVSVNLFYNNGKSQLNGIASGINIVEANAMFDIESTLLAGDIQKLLNTPNGIIIGVGIAEKLNIQLDDNISVISSIGVVKIMKVVGVFKTSNKGIDLSKSYINTAMAQQLLRKSSSYVTDIYVNIKEPDKAPLYSSDFSILTGYKAEDWQAANESIMASKKTRQVMMGSIALAILLVATFGIYNIINMTIKEKLNDIAILKATGFSGKDVMNIFIKESLIMGFIGTGFGLLMATILIKMLSGVYIGGDIGYFPIGYELNVYLAGIFIGMFLTFSAGFIPARNAAKVDPIEIFKR
ncbi:MAG: ABC transporter permease [Bacteroidales bacterium]|jgi:lipoprotein-releasing system permease protein|nr:ABC transporter permease [Bacteroidales bacterium]